MTTNWPTNFGTIQPIKSIKPITNFRPFPAIFLPIPDQFSDQSTGWIQPNGQWDQLLLISHQKSKQQQQQQQQQQQNESTATTRRGGGGGETKWPPTMAREIGLENHSSIHCNWLSNCRLSFIDSFIHSFSPIYWPAIGVEIAVQFPF